MREALELLLESPWFYLLGIILTGTYFYFKKKFENLADKEDVSDITREVESVKKEFNEDLEKLKLDLDVIKADKIALSNDKRKAIYDFWHSINKFEHNLSELFNYSFNDKKDLYAFKNDLEKAHNEFNFRISVLDLLIYDSIDENYIDLKDVISKLFIDFKHDLIDLALEIHSYKTDENSILKDYDVILDKYKLKHSKFLVEYLKSKFLMKEFLVKNLN